MTSVNMRGPFFETVKFGPGAWAQPQARRNELELVCVECGAVSMFGAKGWRGYHTCDDEAAMFCPECAAREFGPES
jgi:hypothetical protein